MIIFAENSRKMNETKKVSRRKYTAEFKAKVALEAMQENLKIMELLDSQYAETPFYGYRRLMALLKAKGHDVSANRLRRLMCMVQREAGVRVREPLPYFRLLQQPPPAPKPWLPVSRDGLHEETGGMILMIGIMDIPDKDTFFH